MRKSELYEAIWREIDLATGVWDLPKEHSKTGVPISIPQQAAIHKKKESC